MTEEQLASYRLKRAKATIARKENTTKVDEEIVDVAEKPPDEKRSLFERITGKVQTAQPKPSSRKKLDSNILSTVLPLVAATLLSTYIKNKIVEPYKVCAPTQEESVLILKPYFSIISRYVEVKGKLSQNMLDIISSVMATLVYSTRAYVSYVEIRSLHDRLDENAHAESGEPRREDRTVKRDSSQVDRDPRDIEYPQFDDRNGASDLLESHNGHRREEIAVFSDLYRRDIEGRKRLGLL